MIAGKKVVGVVLCGGTSTELGPLVSTRAKAAVPIMGSYRIVDFVLSNMINSGVRQIHVMVQYKYSSLHAHILNTWSIMSPALGEYIGVYPPAMNQGDRWYEGTADAIWQNSYHLRSLNPDLVLVVHGDHVNVTDYRTIIEDHLDSGADLTLGSLSLPEARAGRFGNLRRDDQGFLAEFVEKPEHPKFAIDGRVDVNAGVYVFNKDALFDVLAQPSGDGPRDNLSRDIIPKMIGSYRIKVHEMHFRDRPARWAFLNSLDDYFDFHMDLLSNDGIQEYADVPNWPIRSYRDHSYPITADIDESASVTRCLVSSGTSVRGELKDVIVGSRVTIGRGSRLKRCIIHSGVSIGDDCVIEDAIIDKHTSIASGLRIDGSAPPSEQSQRTPQNRTVLGQRLTIA